MLCLIVFSICFKIGLDINVSSDNKTYTVAMIYPEFCLKLQHFITPELPITV